MKNNILYIIIALLVGTGAGFFGGMKYQQSKTPSFSGNFRPEMMRNGDRSGVSRINGNRTVGGFSGRVIGEAISVDDTSITVKLSDGSTKNILVTSSTTYTKSDDATNSDITTGTKVGVFGVTNSDGSVTASEVQINPIIRAMPTGIPVVTQ
jgi:uncharacterized protein YneF (UPF0154 family)